MAKKDSTVSGCSDRLCGKISSVRTPVSRATAEKLNPFIGPSTIDTLTCMAGLVRDLGWMLTAAEEALDRGGVRIPTGNMWIVNSAIAAALEYEVASVATEGREARAVANG